MHPPSPWFRPRVSQLSGLLHCSAPLAPVSWAVKWARTSRGAVNVGLGVFRDSLTLSKTQEWDGCFSCNLYNGYIILLFLEEYTNPTRQSLSSLLISHAQQGGQTGGGWWNKALNLC